MHSYAIALLLAALSTGADSPLPRLEPLREVEAQFVQGPRVVFRAWRARSNLLVSVDGQTLYFCENGPDGLVLKDVNLSTGTVRVRAKVNNAYYKAVAVPGDPDHLLLGEVASWSNPAFRLSVLSLKTGIERALDLGDRGGDGSIFPSPSGRYVVTGINYGCHTGDRDCFAEDLAVICLETGRQEYHYKVPTAVTRSLETFQEDGRNVEVPRTAPLNVSVAWAEEDSLVLSPDATSGFEEVVLQRNRAGAWKQSKVTPRRLRESQVSALTPGTRSLSLTRSADAAPVRLDPTVLFSAGPGRLSAHPLGDRVVILKEAPDKDGWERIEAVPLSWREPAASK